MNTTPRRSIAVAAASGFVGHALIDALRADHDVIALARSASAHDDDAAVTRRACDLFHFRETEHALDGADAAFYLVHSMMPTSQLTQGRFDDLDLLSADNFERAAKKQGVKHIVSHIFSPAGSWRFNPTSQRPSWQTLLRRCCLQ